MSETPPEVRAVREGLELRWSEAREARVADGVVKTYRRRRATRRAAVALAVLIVAGAAGAILRRESGAMTLADGSIVKTLDASTDFVVGEQSADHVEIQLKHGRARFAVTRNPKRAFRVHAGDVDVEVVGTVFEVDREDGHTRVIVTEGRVRVTRGGMTTLLGPGDERDLDTTVPPLPVDVPAPPVPAEPTPPVDEPPPEPQPRKSPPSVSETLREVDGLRLAGKNKAAMAVLRQAIHDRPNDRLTPQLFFTLGRILQDDEHEPAAAAKVFDALRVRSPSSVFAEDALAREVECLVATGAMERARELVRIYEQTYQRGAFRDRLRKLVAPR